MKRPKKKKNDSTTMERRSNINKNTMSYERKE